MEKVHFAIKNFGFGTEPAYNKNSQKNAAKQLIKSFVAEFKTFAIHTSKIPEFVANSKVCVFKFINIGSFHLG